MYEHIHLSRLRQKLNKIDIHSSTTFTVPKGVKKIDCFCVGGGGSGKSYDKVGGTSSVGNVCNVDGGKAPTNDGGDGGSGGGCGGWSLDSFSTPFGGGDGGSDGGDGGIVYVRGYIGGKGQGTTTRYFGESTGTLYAGGGGGGAQANNTSIIAQRGMGGAGGGGNGYQYFERATSGQANTGGGAGGIAEVTGGGGGGYTATVLASEVNPGQQISVTVGAGGDHNTLSGGSGICIIRWSGK